jgi:cytochrome c oxidase assembly protein subunit 15
VLGYLIWLAWRVFRVLPGGPVRDTALFMLLLVVVQVSLGIANVLFQLPMAVAVAHNGVAALLVLTLATLNYFLRPREA